MSDQTIRETQAKQLEFLATQFPAWAKELRAGAAALRQQSDENYHFCIRCHHTFAVQPGEGYEYCGDCHRAALRQLEQEKEQDLGAVSATEAAGVPCSVHAPQLPHDAIEVRMAGGADGRRIDEIVADDASVHLEQMSETEYVLIIETAKERACYSIHACNSRSHIRTTETWKEPKAGSGTVSSNAERAPERAGAQRKNTDAQPRK